MSADTIFFLNFGIHSVVVAAIGWMVVRFVVRDALRRCILANLAVLFCLIGPFNIFLRDVSPAQPAVPVWTPLRETFEADWRVSVSPAVVVPQTVAAPQAQKWSMDVDDGVAVLRWAVWAGVVLLLGQLVVQSVRVQRWAWALRCPSPAELEKLPAELEPRRVRVFDHEGTPCVAGWLFPIIAVPASAFQELNHTQWRWLMRHEAEHMRGHDTVAVLIQHIIRALLWWNPFVHALIEEHARAREEACDAAAVGGERAHTPYAEFLLSWAARPAALPACVMPIAQSLPARRLKVRLTALMEARGVRKKVGALFVLLCLVFAMIAPLLAASFGIATTRASAQEVVRPKAEEDGKMFTRVYTVAPDFLTLGIGAGAPTEGLVARPTAVQLLKAQGVPFPDGGSALFNPAASKLIVRNTLSNLELVERFIDAMHTRPVMVHFRCKLIRGDGFFGAHESILQEEDFKELVRGLTQQRGVNVMSSPSVTTKFDQQATIEVVREVLPKRLPNGDFNGDLKVVGPRIQIIAKSPVNGKSTVDVKVDLGVDPDAAEPWLPPKDQPSDWDKVQLYTTASKKELASGETLVLQLPTAQKPVTVLITATGLKPDGTDASSFSETTQAAPPAREGRVMNEEEQEKRGGAVSLRVYQVPAGFGEQKPPMEYLRSSGIPLPPDTELRLAGEKLTLRTTQRNHLLVEGLLESLINAEKRNKRQILLRVHAVDVKADSAGLMKLMFSDAKTEPGTPTVPPDTLRGQFTVQAVLTAPQFQLVLNHLTKSGHKPTALPEAAVASGKEAVFDLPLQPASGPFKATPTLGVAGNTLDLRVQCALQNTQKPRAITTSVTLWDGSTLVLAGEPAGQEGLMRVIFVSALMFDPAGKAGDK